MNWISIKDQMPLDGELVLCLIGCYYERNDTEPYLITQNVLYHCCMRDWIYVCGERKLSESFPVMKVLYWMSIPIAPSELVVKK